MTSQVLMCLVINMQETGDGLHDEYTLKLSYNESPDDTALTNEDHGLQLKAGKG